MPCYRCGTRQVDPDRGESPWRRGVRADRQVLICPACQASTDWAADLDRCPVCGSVHLVRRLGEAECRDCGSVSQPADAGVSDVSDGGVSGASASGASGSEASGSEASGSGANASGATASGTVVIEGAGADLADEVERALAKVLGSGRQRPPYAMS
jgi:hypothetical protein